MKDKEARNRLSVLQSRVDSLESQSADYYDEILKTAGDFGYRYGCYGAKTEVWFPNSTPDLPIAAWNHLTPAQQVDMIRHNQKPGKKQRRS